ncbi:hypothetical protein QFZ56_004312 [Streptomyces achromogenes]|uniref:DUF2267 domain-containing protein n=1 Tax=Streptomyces achromogenes TaxID=67255 RepID=A0ABU0Q428_STRAH|nr:hypothetical protein [Streptomyces achromogenes]MDQ0685349.1 hypothetical protein [Streptomyces achromogenes]
MTPADPHPPSDPTPAARRLGRTFDGADGRQVGEATRDFVEKLTFATADEIQAMLRDVLAEDWTALPPWARNLAYRPACLARPRRPTTAPRGGRGFMQGGHRDRHWNEPQWNRESGPLRSRIAHASHLAAPRPYDASCPEQGKTPGHGE